MITQISFYFIVFFLASFFCFILPGLLLLKSKSKELTFWEYVALSTVCGFVVFTLVGYILLHLKMINLLLPIIFIVDLYSLKLLKHLKISPPTQKQLLYLILIFGFGILGQLLIISPSGFLDNGNLVFFSSHGHDGSWHIALMEEIKKGFPLQNPIFAGEKLVNYHFFSDISPALFNLYFKIPPLDLYFRFFPFLFSLLLGSLSFYLGKRIGGNLTSGIWASFFTYFSGSFGYIATFIKDRRIGGESFFWASQIQSSSGNPPLIQSLVILLALLLLLKIFYEKQKFHLPLFLISALLLGSLIEFKSYAGIVALSGLATVGIWQLLRDRKIKIFGLFIFGSLISFLLFFPNSKGVGSFLIFEPWWFVRTLIVAKDRLDLVDWELKRQTYLSEQNYLRVLQIELTAFFIFLFGNLGTKFLGFWHFFRLLKVSNNYFNLTLITICLISLTLPLLFLQKGVAPNTIQFLQYFLLIFGIFAGVVMAQLLKFFRSYWIKVIFLIISIALTIPTQIGLIKSFYSRPPLAQIEKEELIALKFLSENSTLDSVIITPPFNKDLKVNLPILPIWAWSDTSYVSSFSGRRTFLSDNEQADIMGYNLENRLKIQKQIFSETFSETNIKVFVQLLRDNKIDYLYFPKFLKPKVDLSKTNLKRIFSNSSSEIWQI